MSVQLSLICLFLKMDLDYLCLCAGRTAPYHSWQNPVERVMSVLNLGLQCVGLAREKMPEEFEKEVAKCNSLNELRKIAERNTEIVGTVKNLLTNIVSHLCLKEKQILSYAAATAAEISDFWFAIIATLEEGGRYVKSSIGVHTDISEFIHHCCRMDHYTFDVLNAERKLASYVDLFVSLKKFLTISSTFRSPYPVSMDITRLSQMCLEVIQVRNFNLHRRRWPKREQKPCHSTQHVKNSQLMVQCEECNMWCLVFSKYKLKAAQRQKLQ